MLEQMMEEFEKRQGFPVHSDMDIQTEVAWENWKAAWAAATSAQRDCRLCAYHTTKVGGCAATVRCVGGAQYKDTARRRYWDDYGLTVHLPTARPPTPIGWSDTDWIKHLQERQNAAHPLAGQHINQGSEGGVMGKQIMVCGVDCHEDDANCNGYCKWNAHTAPDATEAMIRARAREAAHAALNEAEVAWYRYAGLCEVGDERVRTFEIYQNVRMARSNF